MSGRTASSYVPATSRSNAELFLLALLRIGVGWHFAYEGLSKLWDPAWTAKGYLMSADWLGAAWFHRIASNATALNVVDFLNVWGLLLVGGALMLGLLTRFAAVMGILMLALYYLAHPPLFASAPGAAEGSYLIVNKNVVELIALCVVACLPAGRWGLDGLLFRSRSRKAKADYVPPDEKVVIASIGRRQALAGFLGLPFVGGFALAALKKQGYESKEEKQLANSVDAKTGATMKPFDPQTLADLKERVPAAKIGGIEFSRVIMGGNLMNGFAHARDLIYVSKLIRSYHEPWRVYETFRRAEACGINTILTNPLLAPRIVEYWDKGYGKIKFIAQCKGKTLDALLDNVKYSIDNGACAAYIQGMTGDELIKEKKFDWIAKALDLMRDAGLPAGIGGHYIATIKGAVKEGFDVDFWMKTLHHHDYWSSDLVKQHDNIWCEDPKDSIAFMESLSEPWIAFKVLAAGSIHPKDGFKYAFQHGADFVCVGMYDFQVVEDANIAVSVLKSKLDRSRPWCA